MIVLLCSFKNLKHRAGVSLFEAVLAIAIFASIGATMLALALAGLQGLQLGRDQTIAENLAKEGVAALKLIRDEAWNELLFSNTATTLTEDDVMLHWKLNEYDEDTDTFDSSGNGNEGTFNIAGPTADYTWEDGVYYTSLYNTGDDYLETVLSTSDTGPFTVALWVRTNEISQPEYSGIFATDDRSTWKSFQLDAGGATWGCDDEYRFFAAFTILCLGQVTTDWTHLAVTYDGNIIEGFYNGVSVGTVSPSGFFTGYRERFRLFINRNDRRRNTFIGMIDDVRFFNRALQPEEIVAAMHDVYKGKWILHGEGVSEQFGKFNRSIELRDVCRDIDSYALVVCDPLPPNSFEDPHTKEAIVTVSWKGRSGAPLNTVAQSAYISNWSSKDWTQTDWSGGSGQTTWSDATMYDTDDGNVDVGIAGRLSLKSAATGVSGFNGASEVDRLDITNTSNIRDPKIHHISGDVYAVAFRDMTGIDQGMIATFTVDSSGMISNTFLAGPVPINPTFPDKAEDFYWTHISGDLYAITYWDNHGDDNHFGRIVTVEIEPDASAITVKDDDYTFGNISDPVLVEINDDGTKSAFFLTYTKEDSAIPRDDIGHHRIVEIDHVTYDVYDVVPEVQNGSDSDVDDFSAVLVDSDTVAVAYSDETNSGDIMLETVHITGPPYNVDWDFISSPDRQVKIADNSAEHPQIMNVSGNTYAIVYRDDNAGILQTYNIDPVSGNITGPNLATALIFAPSGDAADYPSLSHIIGESYLVVHEANSDGRGMAHIINISSDGTGAQIIDTFEFYPPVGGKGATRPFVISDTITEFAIVSYWDRGISPDIGSIITLEMQENFSGFAINGSLESSAFDTGTPSPIYVVEWDEDVSLCEPTCTVQVQIQTAPDGAGCPGSCVWTQWSGPTGPNSYYTESTGALVPTSHNGDQWIKYRIELSGDGNNTPVLEEIRVNYK